MRYENFHMTLLFMGAVPSGRLKELKSVAETVHAEAFDILIDGVGRWRQARVAYLYPAHATQGLATLAEMLRIQVTIAGFDFDNKTFAPHVTVLRNAGSMPETKLITPILWHIDNFCLVRSTSSERGVRYEILESWALSPERGHERVTIVPPPSR